MSGLISPKLKDELTPTGFAILVDDALKNDTRLTGVKLIIARKANETKGIMQSPEMAAVDLVTKIVLPSERQMAEWGIRALNGPFGCLRLPLPADRKKRKRLLSI